MVHVLTVFLLFRASTDVGTKKKKGRMKIQKTDVSMFFTLSEAPTCLLLCLT